LTGPGGYPAFSAAEMARRRGAVTAVLAEHGAGTALVYGADRSGSAVPWLTGWPVTREAALLVRPGEQDVLFVCYDNHVPNARRLAPSADVRPGGRSALGAAVDWLSGRRPGPGRLAVIGPVPARWAGRLAGVAGDLVYLDEDYTRLRLVKSAEEIAWLRLGAQLSDDAVAALAAAARPGMSEPECCASLESGYVAAGGQTHIHYLGATAMADPDLCVPAQWPSARRLAAGDALSCEVSASYHGYPGQVLRTFTIAADPTPLYRDLHDVAEAAFGAVTARLAAGVTAAELAAAAAEVVLGAGYTVYDDLVHGYGGGYLPPVLRRADVERGGAAEFTLAAGMTVVVQPNVITRDERAGVQAGELVLITPDGWERLHRYPPGLRRIGD
jgi:Xaa-Pro dipeptidase